MDVGALDIIDSKSLTKVKSIPVRRGLHDVALTADGKFAAAGSPGGQFITVFDLQKMEIAWEVNVRPGSAPRDHRKQSRRFGQPDFRAAQWNERILRGGFRDPQGSGENQESRRAQRDSLQGAKASATASASRRTIKLCGPTAARPMLFLSTRSLTLS